MANPNFSTEWNKETRTGTYIRYSAASANNRFCLNFKENGLIDINLSPSKAAPRFHKFGLETLAKLYILFGDSCFCCKEVVSFKLQEIDHITPQVDLVCKSSESRKAHNAFENLVPVCSGCNSTKRAQGREFFEERGLAEELDRRKATYISTEQVREALKQLYDKEASYSQRMKTPLSTFGRVLDQLGYSH